VTIGGGAGSGQLARNHAPAEVGVLGVLLVVCAREDRFLVGDLRAHPANFPESTPSHGLRMRGLY
jgi:hypothetical protein